MKRQYFRYTVLAIALYLVFLIVTAPAVWVAWGLVRFSHGVVSLNQPQGTVWRGQGDLVIHYASSPPQHLGTGRWSVNPLWFFLGKLNVRARVNGPGTDVRSSLRMGYRYLALSDLEASFPAQFAATIYGPLALLSPSGQVRVSGKEFTIDRAGAHGNATVQWQDAGSSLSTVHPFGSYQLSLAGRGQTASLQLDTVTGDLVLTGQGQLQLKSGQLQFNGVAKPAAHAVELEPLLRLLGPDRGGGQRTLVANGLRLF